MYGKNVVSFGCQKTWKVDDDENKEIKKYKKNGNEIGKC